MRIAIVHSYYSSGQASGENVAVDLQVKMLRLKGHEVTLFAKYTDIESQKLFFKTRCAFRILTGFGANFNTQLRQFDPEIVIINNLYPNISSNWIKGIPGKKILIVHNLRAWCSNGFMLRDSKFCSKCVLNPMWGTIYRCSDGNFARSLVQTLTQFLGGGLAEQRLKGAVIAAVSEHGAKMINEIDPTLSASTIPNFIPLNELVVNPSTLDFGPKQGKFVWIGRVSKEKGLADLLEIWPEAFDLDIIGDGPELDSIRQDHSHKSNLNFIGNLPNIEVNLKLVEYLGLVNSSLWPEFGPITVIEALAAGVPVIVPSILGMSQILSESQAGLVYEMSNKSSLLEALSKLEKIENRKKFSNAARQLHDQVYSFTGWFDRLLSSFPD
jgi:glycosyltransferase involved in cell wall biosynthesis